MRTLLKIGLLLVVVLVFCAAAGVGYLFLKHPNVPPAAEQRENTIMPWDAYSGMTREDLGAIYTYLRTQKPVVNRVKKHN